MFCRRQKYLPVVWRGQITVTGPDEIIKEQAELDGVVSFVPIRTLELCVKHCGVIQQNDMEKQ
jgi:hypothetical protein